MTLTNQLHRPQPIEGMNFVFGGDVLKGTATQVRQRIKEACDELRNYSHRNSSILAYLNAGNEVAVTYDVKDKIIRTFFDGTYSPNHAFRTYAIYNPQSVVALIPTTFFKQRAEVAA